MLATALSARHHPARARTTTASPAPLHPPAKPQLSPSLYQREDTPLCTPAPRETSLSQESSRSALAGGRVEGSGVDELILRYGEGPAFPLEMLVAASPIAASPTASLEPIGFGIMGGGRDDANNTSADPLPTSSNPTSDTSAPSPNTSQEPSTSRDASSSNSSSSPSPSGDTDTIPPPQVTMVNGCTGVLVHWPVTKGTTFETFPFHRIGDKPGSVSFNVEIRDRGGTLVAFSKKIPAEVAMLAQLAMDAAPQTNFVYLSDQQKTNLLRKRAEEIRQFRVKGLNFSRKLGTALRKISDYKRFINAVAEQDIPRLRNLVNVGLNRGASVSQIIRTMQMAKTLDMALLIFRLGGRKLLYAVNQSLDIPSLRTLRNNMQFTRVMPTVGWINTDDIEHNIAEVVLKPLAAASKSQPARGVSLQIDEVAIEERVAHSCYGLLGFCWCHSMNAKLRLDTFQDALDLSKMVKDGDVHMGSEMTVVAAGCFGGRPVFPILALPTCKSTGPEESKTIYQTVIEVWNRCARNLVGPVWSFATDGDAKRRKAGFDEFCKTKLPVTSPLYSTLAGMVGMNLYTGLFDITLDSDYKHIFKRVCTQLRSRRGIVLRNGRIINADVLKRFLLRLPGQTEASVQRLLYPDDPQDVPRSVELMEKIVEIGGAGFEASDPEVLADLDSPSMSLTEQMTRLSTFAHLSFSIFRTRRTDFFSNQLYIDSQTMVKNAFFCLAKQQQLEREQPFYLFQTGDDRLERLFGKLRMLGGHNSAMSYHQAIERLGHACDLQGLYLRNPELEQTAVRLNMTRSEHVDHLNMDSWTGDVISGLCHAPGAWFSGSKRAAVIFERPVREGNARLLHHLRRAWCRHDAGPLGDSGRRQRQRRHPRPRRGREKLLQTRVGQWNSQRTTRTTRVIRLTNVFPNSPNSKLPQNRPGFNPKAYLDVGGGKMVHLQRICRLLFNRHYDPKSLDRLKRVCGFKKLNSHRHNLDPNDVHGIDTFLIGDLFLTSAKGKQSLNPTVSLAVVRCTAIHDGSTLLKSTFGATLRDPKSKIKLTGQVLTMELIPTLSDSDTVLPDSLPATSADIRSDDWTKDSESAHSWIWTGSYLVADSAMGGTSKSTDKVITVSIPGILVEPIDPDAVDAGKTWEMRDGAMGAGCELLWSTMVENKLLPKDLPSVKSNGGFPYSFSDGTHALLCKPATDRLVAHLQDKTNRDCHLCGEKKITNW
ncbi:hypothetical protein HMN09_00869400 [Mycena chlorophos]|uniref:Uncharacterized protein n=1 Tax=Mycena chlorophos TaxID=658473 RepID=A0A8H6W5C9_MYCCL|nr:hypothetical protein HMN09_00869400 [Mycena chlorophos]